MNLSKKIYYKVLYYLDLGILPYRILRLSSQLTNHFFVEHNPPESVVNQLQEMGCDSTSHMNRSLLEHFQGTYRLLKKWGNRESICLAGLFHAIYGTETFYTALVSLEKRQEIALLIGDEAEKLVYYYSITTRNHFVKNLSNLNDLSITSRLDGEIIPITELEFRQLVEIFLADRLEQILSLNYRYRYQYKAFFLEAKYFISRQGFQEFLIAYNLKD
ncbi:MAG: hypothetical protein F6K10_08130 [Moorea sp. SIO2B7]|nr:hypothetical protein [Moorena sp. SIO2B7]